MAHHGVLDGVQDTITGAPVRGTITALSSAGELFVDFPGNPAGAPLLAGSITSLEAGDVGRVALLTFEEGDIRRPILLGILRTPGEILKQSAVVFDGQKLIVTAEQQIELRCGEASITLDRSGKVQIRGKYVVSRSSGANLLKGAIVHIN